MMPTPITLMLRTTSGSSRIERNPYLATSDVFRAGFAWLTNVT